MSPDAGATAVSVAEVSDTWQALSRPLHQEERPILRASAERGARRLAFWKYRAVVSPARGIDIRSPTIPVELW